MSRERPLPACQNCWEVAWVNGKLCCSFGGWVDKPINRRHSRSVARKCPGYRYWHDAFELYINDTPQKNEPPCQKN